MTGKRPVTSVIACTCIALAVAGCSKSLPQTEAAPQTSGEAGASPTATPEPVPTFTVPKYSTHLDLTPQEMLAAEEALIGLQRYIYVSERVMKSGGEETARITEVSVDDGKEIMHETADDLLSNDEKMVGHLKLSKYYVESVDDKSAELTACLDNDSHGFQKSDGGEIERGSGDDTMWWTLRKVGSTWKVSNQEGAWRGCTRPS